MALITLADAQLAFGHVALLDHADFSLQPGERVGLIGRNGAGKSSLLKILAGMERPDDGTLQSQQGLRCAFVAQEPVLDEAETVFESVRQGIPDLIALIDEYSQGHGDLDALQGRIEAQDGWNWRQRIDETLQRLHLDADTRIGTLSGGNRKRVALAQALVRRPDVLLLDEPTNHLDLDSIEWLENLLIEFRGSVVLITHDRTFLDRVATRIVELDRGRLLSYPGNFTQYQRLKEEQLAQEAVISAKADKLLAQEEIWVRKGVEARRTRAQGRIVRLQQLRARRAERREALGRVSMDVSAGQQSGKIVAELTEVSKGFPANDGGRRAPPRRCAPCPAASATACCWPACSPALPTCWCSTSRPTTSTSIRWSCWRNCCRTTTARSFSSATTAPSWTTWSPARSPSKARAAGASTRAASRTG
jgi:ATP-binding cassette subfamily F protein uup